LTRDSLSPHDRAIEMLSDNLLDSASGVLHIGAHFGEESAQYHAKNLPVIFIEADPESYKVLKQNILDKPKMRAVLAALGADDGIKSTFHVYNDSGLSSSFLKMDVKSAEGPYYAISQTRTLTLRRLDRLFSKKDLKEFDFWVLDVQGFEFEVLVGSGRLLDLCNILKLESTTRLLYSNAKMFDELRCFLTQKGFSVALPIPPNSVTDAIFIRLPK